MKLTEIRIDNFRSIKECHLYLSEVTAVIGENNAGKTALLRALNSVFNWEYEQPFFLNNAHQYAVRTTTKIVLTFEEIPDKDTYTGKLLGDNLVLEFKYAYGATTRKRSLYAKINIPQRFHTAAAASITLAQSFCLQHSSFFGLVAHTLLSCSCSSGVVA